MHLASRRAGLSASAELLVVYPDYFSRKSLQVSQSLERDFSRPGVKELRVNCARTNVIVTVVMPNARVSVEERSRRSSSLVICFQELYIILDIVNNYDNNTTTTTTTTTITITITVISLSLSLCLSGWLFLSFIFCSLFSSISYEQEFLVKKKLFTFLPVLY